ncbi:hypothetical protein GQ600_4616 [Phytophthora cactorum]|nr:hypothetical protein GQ600_4616 [Phytophthora cactorum]
MLLSPLFLFEPFKFTIGIIASREFFLLRANQSAFREYRELLVSADTGAVRSLQQFDSQWQDYYRAKRSSDDDKEPEDAALLRTKAPAIICKAIFLKPEVVQLEGTTIDSDERLRIHRPIGCEYANAYNKVVMDYDA